jgi:nucleoside-diphosphate-sugar epimerase
MILLTGASGVVGCAIRAHKPSLETLALRHSRPVTDGGAAIIAGDITQPLLGLDLQAYGALCGKLTKVIHSAAVVGMACRPEEYERVNVTGTRHVARLAEDAGATLVHISTAFAAPPPDGESRPSTYEQSKWLAEEVVRSSSAPSVIIRPSIVIGDSRTGSITEEQGIHRAVAKLVEGPVRVVPGDEYMVVDFVPQDYLAAVAAAVAQSSSPPAQLWVTSGSEALTVGQLVEVINEFLDGQEVPGERARAMPFEKVERLVIPILPPRLRAEMRSWLYLARHVSAASRFPSSAAAIERLFGLSPGMPRDALQCNLSAWWTRRQCGESMEVAL